MTSDLPVLGCEEDDGPNELEGCPGGYGEKEGVGGRECAEGGREETGRRGWRLREGFEVYSRRNQYSSTRDRVVNKVTEPRTSEGQVVEKDDSEDERGDKDDELAVIIDSH